MALSPEEIASINELKQKGHSQGEIMGFIAATRAGASSRIENKLSPSNPTPDSGGRFSDVGQDLSTGLKNIGSNIADRFSNIGQSFDAGKAGEQTSIETGLQFGANVAAIPLDVAGQALQTGASLFTSQAEEDAIMLALSDAANATGIPQKYAKLSDRSKRNAGVGLTLLEAATFGAGGRAGKAAIKGAQEGVENSLTATKLAVAERQIAATGVKETGAEGVSAANKLGFSPEQLMQRVARVSKGKQTKFEDRAGQSIGAYLVERDIFGTPDQIIPQLVDRMSASKGRVDEALEGAKGNIKDDGVTTALTELIERDVKVSPQGAPSLDGSRITALFKKNNEVGLTLNEINEVKRLYERNVRVDYANPANPNPTALARSTNIDSALRNLVEKEATKRGFTTIKELNRETSLAKQLLDDLGAEYAGSLGNNNISLTDWILVAEAAGNPAGAAALGLKKTIGSKTAMSATAKLLADKRGVKAELPDNTISSQRPVQSYAEYLQTIQNSRSK